MQGIPRARSPTRCWIRKLRCQDSVTSHPRSPGQLRRVKRWQGIRRSTEGQGESPRFPFVDAPCPLGGTSFFGNLNETDRVSIPRRLSFARHDRRLPVRLTLRWAQDRMAPAPARQPIIHCRRVLRTRPRRHGLATVATPVASGADLGEDGGKLHIKAHMVDRCWCSGPAEPGSSTGGEGMPCFAARAAAPAEISNMELADMAANR